MENKGLKYLIGEAEFKLERVKSVTSSLKFPTKSGGKHKEMKKPDDKSCDKIVQLAKIKFSDRRDDLLKNIITLVECDMYDKFNCIDFACLANGLYPINSIGSFMNNWEEIDKLEVGDCVMMTSDCFIEHMAIYFGDEKYLSKLGHSYFSIDSINGLLEIYKDTKYVYKIRPRVDSKKYDLKYFKHEKGPALMLSPKEL